MKKTFGFIFIIVAGISVYLLTSTEVPSIISSTKPKTFAYKVGEDLDKLRQAKSLPIGWDKIKNVTFFPAGIETKPFLKNISQIFPTNSSGTLELQVEVVELESTNQPQVIFQMSLLDIQSKNKIWELGRTYSLDGIY